MDLSWLKVIAPTVASCLGSPVAGMAVSAIGALFGMKDATLDKVTDALQSGNMTGEQILGLKKVEADLKQHELDNGFRFAELEIRDRDSARTREVAVKDNTNKILAYAIVLAFIGTVVVTLAGQSKAESVMAGTLIGMLAAKAEQVLAYYFGSSKSSDRKTELLSQAQALPGPDNKG